MSATMISTVSPPAHRNQRGFILALAMFAIVALTVVGIASVFLSSGEAEVAGNLRRERQLIRCAQAGSHVIAAKWPDAANTFFNTATAFTYFVNGNGIGGNLVARKGHYVAGAFQNPAAIMTGDAASGVFSAGSNIVNRYGGTSGLATYRVIDTCDGPNGSQTEESTGIIYRNGR